MSSRPPPRAREARVTLGLIGICVLVFGWTLALAISGAGGAGVLVPSLWNLGDATAFSESGGLVLTRVWLQGEWWRVLTAGFVHGSWLHLGLNAWALWDVGRWTERVLGPWRQLWLFVGSSITGCLASLAWAEAPIVVGASAGVFGVASGLVIARRFASPGAVALLEPVSAGRLAFWLVLWLVVGWQLPFLANAGHLGGAISGVVLAVGFCARRRWVAGGALGLWLAVSGVLALVGAAPWYRPNYHLFAGLALVEDGDSARGLGFLDRALAAAPDDPVSQNAAAYALALQGLELERAEQLSRASLASNPDQPDFLDTLGWVLCRQGRVEEGLATLREAEEASVIPIPEIAEHVSTCSAAVVH